MSARCATVLLGALATTALVFAPAAGADTVSSTAGGVTYVQTSDAPLNLAIFGHEEDQPFVAFGSNVDDVTMTCGPAGGACLLVAPPSQTTVVLGGGDSIVRAANFTRTAPLHLDTGGGKDLVDLPRNGSANTVDAGAGDDVVSARNDTGEAIDCGDGYDTVLIDSPSDAADLTTGCERILTEPGSVDGPRSGQLGSIFVRAWPITAEFTFAQPASAAQLLCWSAGAGFSPCANPVLTHDAADGRNVAIFAAQLTVDGQRTDTLSTQFWMFIDRVPPPAPVLDAPTGVIGTTSPGWRVTNRGALREAGVSGEGCALDGQDVACDRGVESAPPALRQGPHTLTARAFDAAGNASPVATYSFVVDTNRPAKLALRRLRIRGRVATISVWHEPGSRLECAVQGSRFVACPTPFVYTARRPRTVLIAFRAVDAAGNVSPTLSVAVSVRPARLTTNVTSTIPDGKLAAACRVSDAVLRSCAASLKVGTRTVASRSSKRSSLRLALPASIWEQLKLGRELRARVVLTAVTTDGQRLRETRRITLRK